MQTSHSSVRCCNRVATAKGRADELERKAREFNGEPGAHEATAKGRADELERKAREFKGEPGAHEATA